MKPVFSSVKIPHEDFRLNPVIGTGQPGAKLGAGVLRMGRPLEPLAQIGRLGRPAFPMPKIGKY